MALTETTRMNITGMADNSLWVIVGSLGQSMASLHGDDRVQAMEMIFAAVDEIRAREASRG